LHSKKTREKTAKQRIRRERGGRKEVSGLAPRKPGGGRRGVQFRKTLLLSYFGQRRTTAS